MLASSDTQVPPFRTYDCGSRTLSALFGTGTSRQDGGPGTGGAHSAVVVNAGFLLAHPQTSTMMPSRHGVTRIHARVARGTSGLMRCPPDVYVPSVVTSIAPVPRPISDRPIQPAHQRHQGREVPLDHRGQPRAGHLPLAQRP